MIKRIWHLGLTKFLGNFNDNAFKSTCILYVLVMLGRMEDQNLSFAIMSIGGMVFMLPFVLLPTIAGWLADRYSKRQVLVALKWLELGIMGMGWLTLWQGHRLASLGAVGVSVVLCLLVLSMAVQSTLFSPSFTGIMPEVFSERDLSNANGIAELLSFLGIIMGLAAGPAFIQALGDQPLLLGLPFVVVALLGVGAAVFIPNTGAPAAPQPFTARVLTDYVQDFKLLGVNASILLSACGAAVFSAIGFMLTTSLLNFGMYEVFQDNIGIVSWLPSLSTPGAAGGDVIHLRENGIGLLQVSAALGIGFGCVVAGVFSGHKIEFGLVPIGALGMAVFCMHLAFSENINTILVSLFLLGTFGGFFVLPLKVYLQQAPDPAVRGKTLAVANALDFWAMFLMAGLMLVLTGGSTDILGDADAFTRLRGHFLQLDSRGLYLGTLVAMVALALYVVWLLPEFLMRMLVFLMTRFLYSLKILNRERLPASGPVLLIANHVSLVDGLLLSAATSRPIHFLAYEHVRRLWFLRPFARWSRLIPIPKDGGPKATQAAIEAARAKLRAGHIVCVFPEGRITGNGMMGEFKRGFLACLPPDRQVPIVPVHLGLLWGSVFSRRYGEVRVRKPKSIPYPVTINFGDPLPADVTPMGARLAVSELDAESEIEAARGEMTIGQRFIHMMRRRPFAKLWQDSAAPAPTTNLGMLIKTYVLRRLLRREVHGDYVGIVLPASTTGAALAMAAMTADKVPVFLNFTASAEAVDYAVRKCQITRIYTARAFVEKAGLPARPDYIYLEDIRARITPADKVIAILQAVLLPAGLAARLLFPRHGRDPHSTATVLFSSGSTGIPKGVPLTHHNLTGNLNGVVRAMGLISEEAILGSLPFFHSFGFMATLCLPLAWGLRVVYHPNPLDADAIGQLVQQHRITMLLATPTFLQAYTRKCTAEQFTTVRLVITGAEKLRPSVAQRFAEKTRVVPIEGYGTTELSPVVSANIPRDITQIGRAIGKDGSVGLPMPGIAVKIIDPATGATLDIDQEGLLLVKGPNVMPGYLDDPERTAEVLQNGWYNTGDMAKLDRDGYIHITGRLSRFSKIGGEMVPHLALEDEINHALGYTDATHAVVTAVDDESRGERIVVLTLPDVTTSPADIVAALRERGLPNLWIPKPKDFHTVAHFPLLGSGKLDLAAVKDLARQLSG